MEEIAWDYVRKNDISSAGRLFSSLSMSASSRDRSHRFRHLSQCCEALVDLRSISSAGRDDAIVAAVLEPELPARAKFFGKLGPAALLPMPLQDIRKAHHRLALLVHPDKNRSSKAAAAAALLQTLMEQLLQGTEQVYVPPISTVTSPLSSTEKTNRKKLDRLLGSMKKTHSKIQLKCDFKEVPTIQPDSPAENVESRVTQLTVCDDCLCHLHNEHIVQAVRTQLDVLSKAIHTSLSNTRLPSLQGKARSAPDVLQSQRSSVL